MRTMTHRPHRHQEADPLRADEAQPSPLFSGKLRLPEAQAQFDEVSA